MTVTSSNNIRSIEEQWDQVEKSYPGLMTRLYKELMNSFTGESTRRSLLYDIYTGSEKYIMSMLIGETADNYTEKMNAVFLSYFTPEQQATTEHYAPCNPIYVRLADTAATAPESKPNFGAENGKVGGLKEDKNNPIAKSKALQLVLVYNHLISGTRITWGSYACGAYLGDCTIELLVTANLVSPLILVFNNLFNKFEFLKTGITVRAVREPDLSSGGADLGVVVSKTDDGHLQSKEYAALIEFKRPNAGFGIAWKLLNGQGWTPDERSAFFKLRDISLSDFDDVKAPDIKTLERKLHSWQKDTAAWIAAEDVLERIGTRRVEAKYSLFGDTVEHKQKLKASYFVNTRDKGPEDITKSLEDAKFKDCFDICHEALADVARAGVLNSCYRVAIVDGLTVIVGSLHEIEKTTNVHANPGNYDNVVDVHLHDTAMMPTYDDNSALYMLEYLCEAAMSNTMVRGVGDQILVNAENVLGAGEVTRDSRDKLFTLLKSQNLLSKSQRRCL